LFLYLRGFHSWPYILRFAAGDSGRRESKTASSAVSVAVPFTPMTRMLIVRDAHSAECSMSHSSFN
jgi:hypothetical protein